jgi:hypothetical protein
MNPRLSGLLLLFASALCARAENYACSDVKAAYRAAACCEVADGETSLSTSGFTQTDVAAAVLAALGGRDDWSGFTQAEVQAEVAATAAAFADGMTVTLTQADVKEAVKIALAGRDDWSAYAGGWSNWTIGSICSVTACGQTGTTTNSRICDNPSPQFGGANCSGAATDSSTPCYTTPCPSWKPPSSLDRATCHSTKFAAWYWGTCERCTTDAISKCDAVNCPIVGGLWVVDNMDWGRCSVCENCAQADCLAKTNTDWTVVYHCRQCTAADPAGCTKTKCVDLGASWTEPIGDPNFMPYTPGSCGRCTEADPSGCNSIDCSFTNVAWLEGMPGYRGSCGRCTAADPAGCTLTKCVELGASWHSDGCHGCTAADPSGCTETPCEEVGAAWHSEDGRCELCTAADPSGCTLTKCVELGGSWNSEDGHCEGCTAADPAGCTETQCAGIGSWGIGLDGGYTCRSGPPQSRIYTAQPTAQPTQVPTSTSGALTCQQILEFCIADTTDAYVECECLNDIETESCLDSSVAIIVARISEAQCASLVGIDTWTPPPSP